LVQEDYSAEPAQFNQQLNFPIQSRDEAGEKGIIHFFVQSTYWTRSWFLSTGTVGCFNNGLRVSRAGASLSTHTCTKAYTIDSCDG